MAAVLAFAARLPAWLWLVAGIAAWGWWGHLQAERARGQLAAEHAQQLRETVVAGEKARAEEQRRTAAQQEIAHDAALQADAARAASARARVLAGRLRHQLAAASAPAGNSTAAPGCPSAASHPDLYSELLERVGDLADEADRVRIAGQACERAYGALTAPGTSTASRWNVEAP